MKKEIKGDWEIVPLSKKHKKDAFDCGSEPLNSFIKTQARQQQDKHLGRTYVAILPHEPEKMLGFYTLSSGSIKFENLPAHIQKKFPRYPIPIARLGRLAVDKSAAKNGLGSFLLWHALTKSAHISEQMGLVAVVVDAKDDVAKAFYEKFGFVSLQGHTHTLCISIETIIELMR